MKNKNLTVIFFVMLVLFSTQILNAQGPVQLSLINSIQIVPENESVSRMISPAGRPLLSSTIRLVV